MAGVTTTKNPKAAKRGTYTIHPPSNAEPLDENGEVIPYVYQPFPKRLYRGPVDAVTGKPDGLTVENDFQHQKALDEGWGGYADALKPLNGAVIDFDEEIPAEAPARKKPGPKPKAA